MALLNDTTGTPEPTGPVAVEGVEVSGLPNTGTGSGDGTGLAFGLLLALLFAVLIVSEGGTVNVSEGPQQVNIGAREPSRAE